MTCLVLSSCLGTKGWSLERIIGFIFVKLLSYKVAFILQKCLGSQDKGYHLGLNYPGNCPYPTAEYVENEENQLHIVLHTWTY